MKHLASNSFIAITGCSGSGKTTALSIIKDRGYPVIDFDYYAIHTIVNDNAVYAKLSSLINDSEPIGNPICLSKIGAFFDANTEIEEEFERWFQPYLGRKIRSVVECFSSKKVVFCDVPFLREKGIADLFSAIWIIESKHNICFNRLSKRNPSYSSDKIEYLINRSSVPPSLGSNAEIIIENNGTISDFEKQLQSYL